MAKFYFVLMIAISCISFVELSPQAGFFDNVAKQVGDAANDGRQWMQGLRIYPGTKWCGPGNIAKNYDDLGKNEAVDKCCRAHDHCPHHILSGETKYNFYNKMRFTISHCKCDEDFKKCLDQSNGSRVKAIYFTVIKDCFILEGSNAKLVKIPK